MSTRGARDSARPALRTEVWSQRRSTALEDLVVALFDEYRDRLLRYQLSLGVTVADGEEIIQEAFLALFRHLQLGRSRTNLRGWLFRVVHNLALKRRADNQRRGEPLADFASEEETVRDHAPDPEEQASHGQTQRRLQAVYRALPDADRRCLALRAEGLRYREIAAVLDMSLGAVSISLARSLARFARAAER